MIITCMRGVGTEFLCASGSQSHYPPTPVNPHFLQPWRSKKNKDSELRRTYKRLDSRSFSPKTASVKWTGMDPAVYLCVCVFHLHSLDLWRLDNRGLCSLNDPMDLNRLSVWELHQCDRWTCCRGVACRHGHLKFRRNVIELPRNTDVKPFQTGNRFIVGS